MPSYIKTNAHEQNEEQLNSIWILWTKISLANDDRASLFNESKQKEFFGSLGEDI